MKAAIYVRVSTEAQTEIEFNSLEAQEAKIRAFISSQDEMEVYKVYSDPGFTGANTNRPGLQELLSDIVEGRIDVVISYKIDRLTRSPKDFYYLIEIFEKHNVSFISVTERFDTSTPAGRLLRNIMLTFAQFERELAGERVKDKMLERAKKGLYSGGVCPLGYQRIDKKLVIEPKEADIIKVIFDTYIESASLFKTFGLLKSKNIKKRNGKCFTKGDIAHILRKVVYNGKIVHLGKIYQGLHEPIISNEQFEQAQDIHGRKTKARCEPAKNFLFPGIVTCENCNTTMTPTYTNKIRKGKRKRYYYYRCTSTLKKEWSSCDIRHISAKRLDGFVVQNLERILQDNHYLESLSFKLNHDGSGTMSGLELKDSFAAMSVESIKNVLQKVVKIASIKEVLNKPEALKKHIKNIIYSKTQIEIKLYKSDCFSALSEGDINEESKCEIGYMGSKLRPKMPPSIFGRDKLSHEKISNSNCAEKVCNKKNVFTGT